MVHIGRVVRDPQRGYCFVENTVGGEKAFLHVSKTVEHSLDDYHRGSYVEFDPQSGQKGVEAHNARLLSKDEFINDPAIRAALEVFKGQIVEVRPPGA